MQPHNDTQKASTNNITYVRLNLKSGDLKITRHRQNYTILWAGGNAVSSPQDYRESNSLYRST